MAKSDFCVAKGDFGHAAAENPHARLAADESEVLHVKPLVWSVLLALPLTALGAEVYRSVGADGKVVYSDVPTAAAQRVTVNVPAPSEQPPPTPTPTPTSASRASADAAAAPSAEVPRPATPAEIRADRARNCELARQKNTTYSTAHRLYRNGPDGERVYLDAAEITAAREQAETDVAEWCD